MVGERKSFYFCKTTKRKKAIVQVYIDWGLFQKVRAVARRLYDVERGAISLAVEEALRLWLAENTQVNTKLNPKATLRARYNAVMENLKAKYYDFTERLPDSVPQPHLEASIKDVFDIKTMRSVYEWLHRFYDAGLIRPLNVKVYKPSDWSHNKKVELIAKEV